MTKSLLRATISYTDTQNTDTYRMTEDRYQQLARDLDACIAAGRPQPSPHDYWLADDKTLIESWVLLDLSHVRSIAVEDRGNS